MSANASVATAVAPAQDRERGHRSRVAAGYFLFATLILALTVYGFDYYTLGAGDRPSSPKYLALKPSGTIGLKLGYLGLTMFLIIFLYPLRKHWGWLMKKGNSRHWLDYHVILGIAAPFVIAFHSSFKFRGFAGMAFWIMFAVSVSGIIGRYLYGQIPRNLKAAELTQKELQELHQKFAGRLKEERLISDRDLRSLLTLPSPERIDQLSLVSALGYMFVLDIARAVRVAKLRRHALDFGEKLRTVGGFLSTGNHHLEQAIVAAREDAALTKRILFLKQSEQVFHLWHVIHKPFSYTFALLASFHIAVAFWMGYRW
ncbi:MAG TPA: hypothetical protein VE083_10660 [Terriglobales bacterium]|nr:hypothetical protein [Terriglobales bacterium]